MTRFQQLYEEELQALSTAGQEYARRYPDRARMLNLDSVTDRDPTVERLLEGFAFLCARVRDEMHAAVPEQTAALVSCLMPHLQTHIPSATVVQMTPRPGLLQHSRIVPRGTEILSHPVGPESLRCRFTTTHDTTVNPIGLQHVERNTDMHGRTTVSLTFALDRTASPAALHISPLRVYLDCDHRTAACLHHFLTTRVMQAALQLPGGTTNLDLRRIPAATPACTDNTAPLLPDTPVRTAGHALLTEYLAFPERMHFVDVHGLDAACAGPGLPERVTLHLTFDRTLPDFPEPLTDMLKLHCTPAVNLFTRDAEPICADGRRDRYRLVADRAHPSSVLCHSVTAVEGVDRHSGGRRVYVPERDLVQWRQDDNRPVYAVRPAPSAGPDALSLVLGGPFLRDRQLREETLSISVRCTNGAIPRDHLAEGDLCVPGRSFPDVLTVRNLTRPSLPARPPSDSALHASFLSHAQATLGTLADADLLRSTVRACSWSREPSRRHRIDAITGVRLEPRMHVVRGAPLAATRMTITIDEDRGGDPYEWYMLASALHYLIADRTPVNALVTLQLQFTPSGELLEIADREGSRWPV